ncbi:hypothetical protein CYMTET_34321, partial [Cymbomonas tetramitiformis]
VEERTCLRRLNEVLGVLETGNMRFIPWTELELGRRLGSGSFGEVYIAKWQGATVAVKRLTCVCGGGVAVCGRPVGQDEMMLVVTWQAGSMVMTVVWPAGTVVNVTGCEARVRVVGESGGKVAGESGDKAAGESGRL